MNCNVNTQMVAQKCFQIAQEIHEEFAENKTNIENEKQTLNKEIEQIITVAPYFRQELTTNNKEILEEATKTAKIRAQKLADLLNLEIEAVETIGGTYLGKSEITYKYKINSNDQEKIDLFASLMGDLSFEYQDATIAANYVSKGNGNAIELVYKVPDGTTIKDIEKTLKDNEIEGSSFSFKNNELSIIAFNAEELENLINKLNNNTNYEYKEVNEQNSRYLDNESRRNTYKSWLNSEMGKQNRSLYYACSKALAICEAAGKHGREDQERQRIEAAKQAASNWDKEHPEIYNEFTDNHLTIEEQQIKAQALADGTFMKAPNSKPTNLNERQWLQVRTKAFKDWFGDWYNKGITVKLAEGTVDDPNFLILKNGKPIGSFTISGIGKIRTQLNPGEKIGYISGNISNTGVEIDAELRGKGFGTAAYIAMNRYLNQQGEVLKSEIFGKEDIGVSAKRVWSSLVKKGLAKETTDGYEMLQDKSVSKVVDENGEPLVVYHGSPNKFTVFNTKSTIGAGSYFFKNKKYAEKYLGETENTDIYSVFLNIKNLKSFNQNELKETTERNGREVLKETIFHLLYEDDVNNFINSGFDGLLAAPNGLTQYVVFNPTQIKSATDNVGTFSEENDDIRFNKKTQTDVFNFIKNHLFDLWHYEPTRKTKEKHKLVHKYLNNNDEIWLTKFLNDENEKSDIQYDTNLSEKVIETFLKEKGLLDFFYVKSVYKFGTTELIGKKLVFSPNPFEKEIQEHSDINDIATETDGKYNLTLLGFLQKRLSIPFKSITQKEAKELLGDKYDSSINAFNLNGTAYFIKGKKINADIKSEEMLHPFIASMHKNNPEVFADLLKDARKLFPQLHIDISNTYSEEQVDEELVTQALARVFVEEKKKNSIPRTMQDFIDKFKKWVASIFSKNPELKLNDFTLQDIAELINSDIEISYEKSFGLNLNKSSDNTITSPMSDPGNNLVQFQTDMEAAAFEETVNKTFPLPNKSVTERSENNTVLLKNLDDIELIYDLKNQSITPIRAHSDMGLNKQSMKNITGNKQNTDLIANLKNILAQTNAKLFNYYNKYSNSENSNKIEKQEIMRNYRILLAQQRRIEEILSQIDNYDMDKMVNSVDNMIDMFTEMFNILNADQQYNGARGVITDPDILYLFRQINEAATMFFDAYGSIGDYMLNEIDDEELIKKINEQLNKWNEIKKAYRDTCDVIINNLEKEAEKYEKSDNFKTGLQKKWQANLKRQIEKGLKDINALNGLFAFDNTFQENTVYPKIMSMIADKVDIETFNEDFWKLNEQFDVIVKKLKNKGVNLSDPKSYGRYFLEKLNDGTETGRLVTCFTPKFRNDIESFKARQMKSLKDITDANTIRQRSRLQDFIDGYDIINIFKLKEAHDENSELYNMLQILTTTVARDNNGNVLIDPNGNIIFSGKQWSQMLADGEYAYDEEYERNIKKLLGADYDRILSQYIKLFSEAVLLASEKTDDNGDVFYITDNLMEEENPFFIMKYLVNTKRTRISTKVLGSNGMYYNLNKMIYIPNSSKAEYFNMDFQYMCSDSNPIKNELIEAYEFFRMVFGDIAGTLYMNDAENTAFAKIPLDSYLDIMANTKNKKVKERIGILWNYMKSKFWDDKKEKKDMSKTNLNYSDRYNKIYWTVIESLKGTSYDNETKEKIAYQIANNSALFEHDFIKLTKNILMLAAIQKRNNIMVEYMTLMRNRFAEIKNNSESTGNKNDAANQRSNALNAWDDQLSRGFKQQGTDSNQSKKSTITKSELIDIIKNIPYDDDLDNAIDNIMKKQKLHIRSNEKAVIKKLIDAIRAINDDDSLNSDFDFEYKGNIYSYKKKFSHGVAIDVFKKDEIPITKEKFIRARSEFLIEKIIDFGQECGINSIVDEIMNLARLGALGGYVMTTVSGSKNRIDGLVADADMDARGFGFTPGNLAKAQKFMMGATLPMGLEGERIQKLMQMFLTKKAYKRFMITKILGTRLKIFQDMTNLLDKNTGGSTMSAWKSNLNPYNMAVQFPEIRNQYDLFIARLLDYKIMDKDGNEHNFIENGEFVALDLDENGNIKLKDDFNPQNYNTNSNEYKNTKKNIQWVTFQTEIDSDDETKRRMGEKEISDIVKLAIDHKKINSRANGDYREMFKKLYSANWASRMLMQMKTYAPEKFKAAWSKGENEDLLGEFYTMIKHGGFFSNAFLVSSAIRKGAHGGIKSGRVLPRPLSRTIKGLTYGIATIGMLHNARQQKMLKWQGQRAVFDLMFLKALLYEEITFIPRTILKKTTNPIKFVFGNTNSIGNKLFNENIDAIVEQADLPEEQAREYREYVENMTEEQKRQHQGNLCALARTIARSTYGWIMRVAAFYIIQQIISKIWGDDDDDEKNKKLIQQKEQFWSNTMKDITESTSSLYQMSFGLGDSYQNVMMVSKIDNIIKGINQMQNMQYSSGTKKIVKNAAIIKSLMTHGFESNYKSNETDWEMAAYALEDKNLDKDNYYDKVFASRATKLKQQLTQAYMDAKTKQTFPSSELEFINTAFKKYNDGKKKNKIDLPSEFDIYKITDDEFKEFLNAKLPKFDGGTKDMYGNKHTGTNRDKVLEYQRWFSEHQYLEPSESGPIPDEMYIDEFSNNPTWEMDFIKWIKDYTNDNTNDENEKNEYESIDELLR